MKKLLFLFLFLLICSAQSWATTYNISPTGSDSANGLTTGTAWLTPNHALNCGDVILAAASTSYNAGNFGSGKWGTVTCPSANNVAWLECATFDACKISTTASDAMWISASFWGVQGWETTVSTYKYGACFHAGPSGSTTVHHIIFANDIANGCMGGGFNSYNASTSASVDYIVYVGNIAYNAAQGTGACYSGFNVYQPIASDTNAGTHMYVAGNYSINNVDPANCVNGNEDTDGEGINFDTFDFDQGGGTAYCQQGVIQNNISLSNGSAGILVENNKTGSCAANIYIKYNTTYGNMKDLNRSFCVGLGEIYAEAAFNVTVTNNLQVTNAATGCSSDAIYAASVANGNNTVVYNTDYLYSAAANNTFISASGTFSYGTLITGTNPAFNSTTIPSAPSCGGTTNVANCMATVISNFTPTTGGASTYGRQTVSGTSVADSLFPSWLCTGTGVLNSNIPNGLIIPGCGLVSTSLTDVLFGSLKGRLQ